MALLYQDNIYQMGSFGENLFLYVDKNFVFNQAVASSTWTIQHNLNKFPSVTSVNINDFEMFGEVEFIDLNNLTITFTGASSGRAFIN